MNFEQLAGVRQKLIMRDAKYLAIVTAIERSVKSDGWTGWMTNRELFDVVREKYFLWPDAFFGLLEILRDDSRFEWESDRSKNPTQYRWKQRRILKT